MKYTNKHDISLPVAVWLLYDEYDYIDKPNYISATTLLSPTKALVLARRIPKEDKEFDVSDFIASSLGTAVHDSMEKAWKKAGAKMMKLLGYPPKICDNIVVNPDEEYLKLNPNAIPVWVENRSFREIDGYIIGGKYDLIIDGRLFDNKTTSVYSYIIGGKDEDYSRQGSVYKWLNPDKVTDDYVYIQFIFTDWKKAEAKSNPEYPQLRVQEHPVKLLDSPETEKFLRAKIREIERYKDLAEEDMPECTDEELWRSDPQFKYYSDPAKTSGRSTKNFDNLKEANEHMASKGGKGIVIAKPGEVKRCPYCPAFQNCEQRKQYFPDD